MQDYAEQLDIWTEIPPPFVSLSIIARAHGAKFGSGAGSSAQRQAPAPIADPESMMGFFGQAEPVPYRAPARGLPILH